MYAHIGSVSSFSNQGTVATSKIISGMGPELPSEPVGDGLFYTSDSESLDGSECHYLYVPRSPQRKIKSHADSGTELDLNKQSNFQRSKGVQRYERNELYAHIGSVSSFSNQGTVSTSKNFLGMGPEFSSESVGDGPFHTSDSESLDESECPHLYVPRSPQRKIKSHADSGTELDLNKQSNFQRSKAVQRYQRNELYAHIGLVFSFSNQGTVPTSTIILGMGPEFSSEPVDDGLFDTGGSESLDGSACPHLYVPRSPQRKMKSHADS